MKSKDALAILGKLTVIDPYCQNVVGKEVVRFNDLESYEKELFLEYLENLNLPYQFVYDVIDYFYGIFYHQEFGGYDTPLKGRSKKCYSEFDYVCVDSEKIRIGVWCEVDGFIAWLDQYKTHWFVDSKKYLIKKQEEYQKWFDEHFGRRLKEIFEKAYNGSEVSRDSKTVKITKLDCTGLVDYKRAKKD